MSPLRIASNPEGQVSSTIQERGRTATRFFPDRRAASNRSNGGYRGQDSAHDPHHEVEEIYPISTYSSSAWARQRRLRARRCALRGRQHRGRPVLSPLVQREQRAARMPMEGSLTSRAS